MTVSAAYAQQQHRRPQRLSARSSGVDGKPSTRKDATAARSRSSLPMTWWSAPCEGDARRYQARHLHRQRCRCRSRTASQKALEVHISASRKRDGAIIISGWYGAPHGTLTNGFVQPTGTVARGLRRPAIQASWSSTPRARNGLWAGERADRAHAAAQATQAGASFRGSRSSQAGDGTYTTSRISVGP